MEINGHYYSLYQFTKIEIAAARKAAAGGDKDQSRRTLRFIRNARIIEVLKPIDFTLPVNIPLLEWELRQLEIEVHPVAPVMPTPSEPPQDDTELHRKLDALAYGIGQILSLQTKARA